MMHCNASIIFLTAVIALSAVMWKSTALTRQLLHPYRSASRVMSASPSISKVGSSGKGEPLETAPIPRAAVSVCDKCHLPHPELCRYMLVKRGKEPNKGMWSLAGGRIEYGEIALEGGIRELKEETAWLDMNQWNALNWYSGTVCTTDAIGEGYHYLIAHVYAELKTDTVPVLQATDDADGVDWFDLPSIYAMADKGEVTIGVISVLDRIEQLYTNKLLPTKQLADETW